jgi:hypothetical protein
MFLDLAVPRSLFKLLLIGEVIQENRHQLLHSVGSFPLLIPMRASQLALFIFWLANPEAA